MENEENNARPEMNCGNIVIAPRNPRWNVGNAIELQLRYFKACHTHSLGRPFPFVLGPICQRNFCSCWREKGSWCSDDVDVDILVLMLMELALSCF